MTRSQEAPTQVTPRTRARRRAARARRRRERLAGVAAELVGGAVALGVLAGALSGGQWPWVVATYVRWPHVILGTLAAGVLLWLRWWRTGLVFAVVAAATIASVVAPLTALDTVDAPRGATLRIVVYNTGAPSGDVAEFAATIRAADPDLVVLLESTDIADRLDDRLTGLSRLPVRPVAGAPDPPVVLARRPWPARAAPLAGTRPAVVVGADIDGAPIDVVAVHPLPPVTSGWAARHDRAISALVDTVLPRPHPFVLACDCNATPWTPSMRRLLDAGLRAPTVAATFGAPIVGAPLDHVLLGEDVAAVSRQLGPFAGSDHRMIVTGVTLQPATGSRAR